MNPKTSILLFVVLAAAFLGYSFHLYSKSEPEQTTFNKTLASEGRLVWQKYNCQSCHQLYGLGGYLGPDLTNVYSALYKGEDYIKGFVLGGTNQMPAFALNDSEMVQLMEFLKMTDASGVSDPRLFTVTKDGMIQTK